MFRIAAHVHVAVPPDRCIRFVQESLVDARWQEAYRTLRPGRAYSGWVTAVEPGRRIALTVAALEPVTGKRLHALGYRVVHTFTPEPDGRTRAEVAIEYSFVAAVAGMGMLGPQAENEVLHRLSALLALEAGAAAASADATAELAAAAATPALHAGGVAEGIGARGTPADVRR